MSSKDPDTSEYYFPFIFLFLSILAFLNFISISLESDGNENPSLDGTLSPNTIVVKNKEQANKKNSLRFRYLFCYLIVRASIWSKAAYVFLLYMSFHKFHVYEIGFLYIIDYLSSLIISPFTGALTDIYGRKLFSIFYNILVILNLTLRLTGIKSLAYIAQFLTGIGTGIVNTSYESWVVCESRKLFRDEKVRQKFLKKLFKK